MDIVKFIKRVIQKNLIDGGLLIDVICVNYIYHGIIVSPIKLLPAEKNNQQIIFFF